MEKKELDIKVDNFYKNLLAAIKKKGISQSECARKMGYNVAWFNQKIRERGFGFKLVSIYELSEFLDIDPRELFRENETK